MDRRSIARLMVITGGSLLTASETSCGVPWVRGWFYLLAWWCFIPFVDGWVYLRKGSC